MDNQHQLPASRELEPEEIYDSPPEEHNPLADRVARLEKEISTLRTEMDTDRRHTATLFRSLKITFGTGQYPASSAASTSAPDSPLESNKWDQLKVRLGGKKAEIIDALQLSSPATTTQISKITGGAFSTVKESVYKLRDMGLIIKNGDGWSLKQ